jgi:uncharacterized protein (TIGR00255 family)
MREGVSVTAEARSVNNRFFEVSTRLPRQLQVREAELRDLVRAGVSRGKVTLSINVERGENAIVPLQVNSDAVRAYAALLRNVADVAGISGDIPLDALLRSSDLFFVDASSAVDNAEWEAVREAVQAAVAGLAAMRSDEGRVLTVDLRERIDRLDAAVNRIEELSVGRGDRERARLRERVTQLVDAGTMDPGRLELEIVLLCDKLDITEELVRFRSHSSFFRVALDSQESEGRKLSFLLQEMNREANTIASKSYDAEIAQLVVGMKEELERIREQIQNIE